MSVIGLDDALAATQLIRAAGARTVLASLGPDGALLVDDTGAYHGIASAGSHRSTVGAGDAMLAGFLKAGGGGVEALTEAVAWGTAAVSLPGSRMPGPSDLDRAAVHTTQLNLMEVASEHAHHA
jgi:1-phosphofructokinase